MIDKRMALKELPVQYRDRPTGSVSKLNTVQDGIKVLKTIFRLFRFYRPQLYYGILAGIFIFGSLILFVPVFVEYLDTGLVPRQPTLIVSGLLAVMSLLAWVTGSILGANKKTSDQMFEILAAWQNL
jgi:hypothetical protein